ncbi:MAG: hypothetical protein MJK14_15075 [Rivularia sp. ALOHA_DT_140]|nr:hypothetical protein [Rivularia sp. ALOHA_DT_140]
MTRIPKSNLEKSGLYLLLCYRNSFTFDPNPEIKFGEIRIISTIVLSQQIIKIRFIKLEEKSRSQKPFPYQNS